jgi:hypothetical protein
MATSFDLTEIKFENIGKWALVSGRLEYQIELKDRSIINFPNALYAFVVNAEDSEGGHVVYIGKTTKSLKNSVVNNQQTTGLKRRKAPISNSSNI